MPRFVLGELQLLADSNDGIKRERGRRGLDILNQLQRSREIDLTIHDSGLDDSDLPIDARLVRVAQVLQARLLTNDQALGQVARLQQVPVLNLNDLSRALRPVVVPGDELELNLVKEGRDPHQAVGYLPDGTMIVVNQGRPHIGRVATVVVSSALQTGGGRLIFAELKENARVRTALQAQATARLTKTDRAAHSRHHFVRDRIRARRSFGQHFVDVTGLGENLIPPLPHRARKTPRVARKVAS